MFFRELIHDFRYFVVFSCFQYSGLRSAFTSPVPPPPPPTPPTLPSPSSFSLFPILCLRLSPAAEQRLLVAVSLRPLFSVNGETPQSSALTVATETRLVVFFPLLLSHSPLLLHLHHHPLQLYRQLSVLSGAITLRYSTNKPTVSHSSSGRNLKYDDKQNGRKVAAGSLKLEVLLVEEEEVAAETTSSLSQ